MAEPDLKPNADATANDNGAPPDELAALKAKLQAAEKDREKFHDLAARTQADFENYQKRFQRDLAVERRFAQAPLASDLLGPLDNLERAIAAAQKAGETGPLAQGVGMIQSQLLDALRRHGVTRIEAQGAAFDPNLHQAVMQQPSKDFKPFTVLQVLEPGYMIHDRVLRPARVIVSAAPAADEQKEGE
jgi:molecular chaperone GrpE